jgi:carbon storage regulator CsrA
MLVLTRKMTEQIQVGENVTITVLSVKGRTVRLGIEAPQSVRVLRTEVQVRDLEAKANAEQKPDRVELTKVRTGESPLGRRVAKTRAKGWGRYPQAAIAVQEFQRQQNYRGTQAERLAEIVPMMADHMETDRMETRTLSHVSA